MTLLLLGGTNDAKYIATQLHQHHVDLVYSVAGLVRQPDLPCPVISGGFTQYGGLSSYIKQYSISMILDSTHPFAKAMSTTAMDAAKKNTIIYWRYQRPVWEVQEGDHWEYFREWTSLVNQLANPLTHQLIQFSSCFLTVGQLTDIMLQVLVRHHQRHPQLRFFLRTAVPSTLSLPHWITNITQLGSFKEEQELSLMRRYHIDVLVSKNSGGIATEAKLKAARTLQIPVFMLQRPVLPATTYEFDSKTECVRQLLADRSKVLKK